MLAVVKTPHIEINIKGEIPEKLISVLEEEYGQDVEISEEDDEELVDIFETDWYKDISARMIPGDYLRIYRENFGFTQAELGKRLGNIPRQYISNMERGTRNISLKMAKRLAKIFDVSPEKFI
jgi:DNA-binding XRE family transcriptional regulator